MIARQRRGLHSRLAAAAPARPRLRPRRTQLPAPSGGTSWAHGRTRRRARAPLESCHPAACRLYHPMAQPMCERSVVSLGAVTRIGTVPGPGSTTTPPDQRRLARSGLPPLPWAKTSMTSHHHEGVGGSRPRRAPESGIFCRTWARGRSSRCVAGGEAVPGPVSSRLPAPVRGRGLGGRAARRCRPSTGATGAVRGPGTSRARGRPVRLRRLEPSVEQNPGRGPVAPIFRARRHRSCLLAPRHHVSPDGRF